MPYFEKLYNLPPNFLGVDETFVVKYAIGEQEFLAKHKDGDDLSFVIVLNDDFEGGGTYFINAKDRVEAPVGSVVIFCGANEHMGVKITQGVRYILTGFLSLQGKKYCLNKTKEK